jgi:hypothetical protein
MSAPNLAQDYELQHVGWTVLSSALETAFDIPDVYRPAPSQPTGRPP